MTWVPCTEWQGTQEEGGGVRELGWQERESKSLACGTLNLKCS